MTETTKPLKLGTIEIPESLVKSLKLTSSKPNVIFGTLSLSKGNQTFMVKSVGDGQCQFVSANMVDFHESMLLWFLYILPSLFS